MEQRQKLTQNGNLKALESLEACNERTWGCSAAKRQPHDDDTHFPLVAWSVAR